jgi:hypothetical protein
VSDPLEDFAHRALGVAARGRIDAAMVEVMGALGEAGVDALVLKGVVIARWLYDEHEVRGYRDCDLLADPARFATAGRTLEAIGFQCDADEAAHPCAWDEARAQVWHRLDDEVVIDLHWRLPGTRVAPERSWAVLWAGRETMDLGVAQLDVLSEPARALHLATSLAWMGPEARRAGQDLERGIAMLPQATWRDAARMAEQLGAWRPFAGGLRLGGGRGEELLAQLRLGGTDGSHRG